MLFPNEKVIYEIPIYSMPKKEFKRRWGYWKQKWYDSLQRMGRDQKEIERTFEMIVSSQYPRNVWEYNQIVGFVEIKMNARDIIFNVQKTLDTRIYAVAKTKHFIQDMRTIGLHFQVGKMCNEELVAEIDNYLEAIEKTLSGKMCLYLDTFNVIKKHVDFKGIHEGMILEYKERDDCNI